MSWGLDKDKVRSQWAEWNVFRHAAGGDHPAGLTDMIGRPFAIPAVGTSSGDDYPGTGPANGDDYPSYPAAPLSSLGSPEQDYALVQLAHLTEARVLTPEEFVTLSRRLTGA